MKRWTMAAGIAALALVAMVGTAFAVGPSGAGIREQARQTDTVSEVLGLSQEQVMALRQQGLSLAEIGLQQGVDTETLVTRLTEQARERIAAQVEAGVLQPDEAAQLQAQVEEQVRARISDASLGGQGLMLGASLGAGAGNGPEASTTGTAGPYGTGTGECDGTGPYGRMGD